MPSFIAAIVFVSLIPMSSGFAQMIVGHRGASVDAPENTIAAFKLAWQQNADGIEGDFHLTADGRIVCIHDKTTERTAATKLNVSDSKLADLCRLDVGRWKDAKWKGESIPTFAEVFDTVPAGKTFVIELKSKKEIVEPLRRELDRLDHSSVKLIIISFDADTIQLCKDRMPNVKAHWLTAFSQDTPTAPWRPTASEVAATVRRCRADGVGAQGNREVIDESFVETLRRNDCKEFHVWTVDEPNDARYFASLGAVGITTNVPGLIHNSLGHTSENDF